MSVRKPPRDREGLREPQPDEGDPEMRGEFGGRSGGGDSAGGPYPNPHDRQEDGESGFMGHGGQSEMAYHGKGRLGGRKVGVNANAPARERED